MSDRRLPVRPDLTELEKQAKDLLKELRAGSVAGADATLADAQRNLAQSYGSTSWTRLVQSCRLIDAIWNDDLDAVRELVTLNPSLLTENAGIGNGNWGPPASYAANLGRDRIIRMLHDLGAKDLTHAMARAALQGHIDTARMLYDMLGRPPLPRGQLGGPAYTLSVEGTALMFELGAEVRTPEGQSDCPVDVVIESDGRHPVNKHAILEMYAKHGFVFPDTPVWALHRGRIDLLDAHLKKDPGLLRRTFAYSEIYPPELQCRVPPEGSYDEWLPRTPLAGTTLLHMCVEYDELDIARWLLDRGMSADVTAAVDANGFGGHTPLFNAVVSHANFWMNFTQGWTKNRKPMQADFAELLLERGATPNARASLRDCVKNGGEWKSLRDHHDVTPIAWGEAFHNKMEVSEPAMKAIAARGGHR
jgi:hypothetical protein